MAFRCSRGQLPVNPRETAFVPPRLRVYARSVATLVQRSSVAKRSRFGRWELEVGSSVKISAASRIAGRSSETRRTARSEMCRQDGPTAPSGSRGREAPAAAADSGWRVHRGPSPRLDSHSPPSPPGLSVQMEAKSSAARTCCESASGVNGFWINPPFSRSVCENAA
jgi:hypothetical protein